MNQSQKTHVLVIFPKPIILEDTYADVISDSFGTGTSYSAVVSLLLRGEGIRSLSAAADSGTGWAQITGHGGNIFVLKEDIQSSAVKKVMPTIRVISASQIPELLDSSDVIIHY